MTVEFFGLRGMGQIGGLNKAGQTGSAQKSSKSEKSEGTSFASTLQGAAMSQGITGTEDAERAARVQELKSQVSSGTYEPDLNKVAASLMRFLVEG